MRTFEQWRDDIIADKNQNLERLLSETFKEHEGFMRMAWEACERNYREPAPIVMTLDEALSGKLEDALGIKPEGKDIA